MPDFCLAPGFRGRRERQSLFDSLAMTLRGQALNRAGRCASLLRHHLEWRLQGTERFIYDAAHADRLPGRGWAIWWGRFRPGLYCPSAAAPTTARHACAQVTGRHPAGVQTYDPAWQEGRPYPRCLILSVGPLPRRLTQIRWFPGLSQDLDSLVPAHPHFGALAGGRPWSIVALLAVPGDRGRARSRRLAPQRWWSRFWR